MSMIFAAPLTIPQSAAAQTCKKPISMILMDRSSSMTQLIGGASKWQIARDAIDNMLTSFDSQIEFGLMYAASADLCTTGGVAVVPKLGARSDIITSIDSTTQTTLTPLYGVLYSSWQELKKTQYDGHPKSVILVTDGGESCHKFANNLMKLIPELNALVAAMAVDGIAVYIVGFGDAVAAITLNQMAVAAKTERITPCNALQTNPTASDNCYYNAADAESLKTMLSQIALKVTEEKCDGLDNNCDGKIDENLVRPCDTACGPGTETCVMGKWESCTAPQGNNELCNGKDDDCDGKIDNGYDVGASCTAGLGECQVTGKKVCASDQTSTVCDATPKPKGIEVCDGKGAPTPRSTSRSAPRAAPTSPAWSPARSRASAGPTWIYTCATRAPPIGVTCSTTVISRTARRPGTTWARWTTTRGSIATTPTAAVQRTSTSTSRSRATSTESACTISPTTVSGPPKPKYGCSTTASSSKSSKNRSITGTSGKWRRSTKTAPSSKSARSTRSRAKPTDPTRTLRYI
ncbi:MAG: VWA domain-containing protein [Myxococcales bacterium]|nr:VWA domain-containing protein [Myxococcales bacterium]